MAGWLNKLKESLSGHTNDQDRVREIMRAVMKSRTHLQLETVMPGTGRTLIMVTSLAQVREDDLVISQPSVGGMIHPLATGEQVLIRVLTASGPLAGASRSLGRVKIPSGGRNMFYGYRLALPDRLDSELERRTDAEADQGTTPPAPTRRPQGDGRPPELTEVELLSLKHSGPIHGIVERLTPSGLRIRSRNALGKMDVGQEVYLKIDLPEPAGLIADMVRVTHVEPCGNAGQLLLELTFKHPIKDIEELLRSGGWSADDQRRAG